MPGFVKKRKLRHQSLLVKTTIVLICIFVVPLIFLYSLMREHTNSSALDDAYVQIDRALDNLSDNLDDMIDGILPIINRMQSDATFSDLCFSSVLQKGMQDYDAYLMFRQIGRSVYQYYLSSSIIQGIELYNPYCGILFTSEIGSTRHIRHLPDDQANDLMGNLATASKYTLSIHQTDDGCQFLLRFSLYSSNDPRKKLYVRMSISSSLLAERYQRLFSNDLAAVRITDNAGNTCLLGEYTLFQEPDDTVSGHLSAERDGQRQIITWQRSAKTGWRLLSYGPLENFNTSAGILDRYFRYFLIALSLILVITIIFLYFEIIRPLHRISVSMKQAERGDLDVRLRFRQHDEIGYIGHRFNAMLLNIQNLIRENYEVRLLRNEFELKFVQTQLKEHFIYNTLDSIHWIAVRNHVPEISEIIFSLSRFFRLTLSNGADRVTVAEARDTLDCYLSLVNRRLDDPIDYSLSIEDDLASFKALKYPFQPIVENAYQHGVGHQKGGMIRISFSFADAQHLRFSVEDNGNGMSAERLSEICGRLQRHAQPSEQEDCFALLNIDRQLHLYFGDDYRFLIDSAPGQGTRVILEYPLQQE